MEPVVADSGAGNPSNQRIPAAGVLPVGLVGVESGEPLLKQDGVEGEQVGAGLAPSTAGTEVFEHIYKHHPKAGAFKQPGGPCRSHV